MAKLGACANDLTGAAKAAQSGTDADRKAALVQLASSASGLAEANASVDVARVAFAETSRTMIATLAAAPTEAGDYRIFECAMVEGKPQWVQPTNAPRTPTKERSPTCSTAGPKCTLQECQASNHGDHKGMKHDDTSMKDHADHKMDHRKP